MANTTIQHLVRLTKPKRRPILMDQYNWTNEEIAYLVNLTTTDCVRLKGLDGAQKLRKMAHRVRAKLWKVQGDRV